MRRLITSDSHLVPPFWLAELLPPKWRDQFPRVETQGAEQFITYPSSAASASQMMITSGGRPSRVRFENDAELARINHSNVCEEARPDFGPVERLEEMEREGVIGAVLIDNAVVSLDYTEIEAEKAWCQIVNDWMAETYEGFMNQFAPGIHLPLRDIPAAVKELERAAIMGLRPAVLPDAIQGSPYSLPEWEPLWEMGAALGIPFSFHVGGTRFPRLEDTDSRVASLPGASLTTWYLLCTGMAETLGWFAFSGLLQKYPELTLVMTEGYAGWFAFAMQFFDHHWSSRWGEVVLGRGSRPKLDALPSHYLRRQTKATFMWDPLAISNRAYTGTECLLWGNDYPHIEGSYPDSQSWVEKQFVGVPEEEIDKIVYENAARVFRLGGGATGAAT
jgi:predicted TIM-barrel fold metal-dependent hydrolase